MNRTEEPLDQQDPGVIERRKRQIWLTVIVMLLSFCVGTTGLLALLWFLIKYIIPGINF